MSNPESPMTPVLTVSGTDRAYSWGNLSMMLTLSLNIIVFPDPDPEQDQIRNAARVQSMGAVLVGGVFFISFTQWVFVFRQIRTGLLCTGSESEGCVQDFRRG